MSDTAAIIMHGAAGTSPGERIVSKARQAAIRDLVDGLHAAGADRILLISNDLHVQEGLARCGVERFTPVHRSPFDAGQALQDAVREHRLRGFVYFGSGTGSLLHIDQLRDLVAFAAQEPRAALLNNPFSVDFAAVSGAQHLPDGALPPSDNALGFALAKAGYTCRALPRTLDTQFDIDTPTDACLLAATGRGGPHLRAGLRELRLPTGSVTAVLHRLVDRAAHVYLLGRVNPRTWAWFESQVACRTSGTIEGRGMRGYPTGRGTLLGGLLGATSPTAFFDRLGQLCSAALIDSRPLLSDDGLLPPAADRFSSDLLQAKQVADPRWAAFTASAAEASVPVLVGGHNLVSGGLYLLGEMCWHDTGLPRRLPVEDLNPGEESNERPYPRRFSGEDRSPGGRDHRERGAPPA